MVFIICSIIILILIAVVIISIIPVFMIMIFVTIMKTQHQKETYTWLPHPTGAHRAYECNMTMENQPWMKMYLLYSPIKLAIFQLVMLIFRGEHVMSDDFCPIFGHKTPRFRAHGPRRSCNAMRWGWWATSLFSCQVSCGRWKKNPVIARAREAKGPPGGWFVFSH